MKEFAIFEKHFVWTRTRIINCMIIGVFALIFFTVRVLKIENSVFFNILIWVFVCLYLSGFGLKLANLSSIQQLKGSLRGNIVFAEDYIEINKNRIPIEEIKKIKIEGIDWIGSEGSNLLFDFDYENGLSNGTNNFLKIEYGGSKKLKIRFQRKKACEFKEIDLQIRHYYLLNKMEYLNCVDILCLSSQSQWNEFKNLKKSIT